MKRPALIVVLVILAAGCERSSSPKVARSISEREISLPAVPVLAEIAGKWGKNGQEVVSVTPRQDGSAVLRIPEGTEEWRVEIRNARIDNGKIMYDQYYSARDTAGSPLEGMRHSVVLEPIPGFHDRVRLSVRTEAGGNNAEVLTRLE